MTWPITTVFGFIAQPDRHMFLKPNVTRVAAAQYGFSLNYQSRPNWTTYSELLAIATRVRRDLRDLGPRDMIDVQSFLWVQVRMSIEGARFVPRKPRAFDDPRLTRNAQIDVFILN